MAQASPKSGPEIEAHVMGHPKGGGSEGTEGQLGACPFSLRVLMVLEEKQIPYRVNFVDVTQKPKWLGEVNAAGTLPVIRDLASGQWLPDSDAISDFLEQKYAARPAGQADEGAVEKKRLRLVTEAPQPAPKLWLKLMAYLKAAGQDEEAQARGELCGQLQMLEDTVNDAHPYVAGRHAGAWDFALAPRAFLCRLACRHFKGWDLGDDYPHIKEYIMRMTGRPSWRNAASWDDERIVADLERKLAA